MPTDPTPTPRDLCGKRLTRANGDWLPCPKEVGHHEPCGIYWGSSAPPTWNPRDVERRKSERRALAASPDAPLSAERRDTLQVLLATEKRFGAQDKHSKLIADIASELLAAYDAQTAALAASRAEGDAIALMMEYTDGRTEEHTTRELQRDLLDRLHKAEAERDALRERVQAANGVINKYGQHFPWCVSRWIDKDAHCPCGFTKALDALATPARPTDTGRDG